MAFSPTEWEASSIFSWIIVPWILPSRSWQPVERFWLFQGIERITFLALAAGLITAAALWLRKKYW